MAVKTGNTYRPISETVIGRPATSLQFTTMDGSKKVSTIDCDSDWK